MFKLGKKADPSVLTQARVCGGGGGVNFQFSMLATSFILIHPVPNLLCTFSAGGTSELSE